MNKFKLLALTALAATLLAPLSSIAAAAKEDAPGPDPSSIIHNPSSSPLDTAPVQAVLDGLCGRYGWLTTVLLAIGSLRLLFKPVMLVIENALKNSPAKLEAVQEFEAGPIYKVIATVLDVGASIKLPLIKPPGQS